MERRWLIIWLMSVKQWKSEMCELLFQCGVLFRVQFLWLYVGYTVDGIFDHKHSKMSEFICINSYLSSGKDGKMSHSANRSGWPRIQNDTRQSRGIINGQGSLSVSVQMAGHFGSHPLSTLFPTNNSLGSVLFFLRGISFIMIRNVYFSTRKNFSIIKHRLKKSD